MAGLRSLANHCNEPTGVYFAFTFRDAAGKVVGVDTTNTGTLNVEENRARRRPTAVSLSLMTGMLDYGCQ